jgi:PST family polysaccharide transporter
MGNSPVDNLRQSTISGMGWSVAARLGRQGFQFAVGVILARLLTPDAFGLIGMVAVFVAFAGIFTDLGFGSALIQKQETRPAHYQSIFWLNIAVGLFLTLLFLVIAPLIARFYDEPLLTPLTMLISLNFLIGSFGVVHNSRLKKGLRFKRLAIVELIAIVVSGVIAIVLALLGFGVWALAIQSVLLTFSTVVLLWIVSDWRPALKFNKGAVRELVGFSSNLLGFSSLNYWIRNSDNLLVGRFLGTSALGIYSRAYSIMLLPLTMVSKTIGQVMFPAFSKIQDDKGRVGRIY